MQRVLEAPEVQDEERSPMAIDDGYATATVTPHTRTRPAVATARRPIAFLRAILSALKRQSPQHMPEGGTKARQPESAFDYAYRIDPYICIRALIG